MSLGLALDVAGTLEVQVATGSMRPWFGPGTTLRIRSVVPREPLLRRVVVAVDDSGRQLAHRVVRDERDVDGTLLLRGDASKGSERITEADVIGVVTAIRVRGRWVSVEEVPRPLRHSVTWLGRQWVMAPWRLRRVWTRALA
ncbi:MAG: hypothetical protein CMN30_14785 [Sandaracinus sp.]|nr:hypothetical protein [Sandaracinus sp.]